MANSFSQAGRWTGLRTSDAPNGDHTQSCSQAAGSSAAGEPKHTHTQNKTTNAAAAHRTDAVRNLIILCHDKDVILNIFSKDISYSSVKDPYKKNW